VLVKTATGKECFVRFARRPDAREYRRREIGRVAKSFRILARFSLTEQSPVVAAEEWLVWRLYTEPAFYPLSRNHGNFTVNYGNSD